MTAISTLNPGIQKVVTLLNEHGFKTCDSGDGETHEHACDRPYGYVVIQTSADILVNESVRLMLLLRENGVLVEPIGLNADHPDGPIGTCIQANYDPVNGLALIDVQNIHDRMLKS